jgi:hypothetical protein
MNQQPSSSQLNSNLISLHFASGKAASAVLGCDHSVGISVVILAVLLLWPWLSLSVVSVQDGLSPVRLVFGNRWGQRLEIKPLILCRVCSRRQSKGSAVAWRGCWHGSMGVTGLLSYELLIDALGRRFRIVTVSTAGTARGMRGVLGDGDAQCVHNCLLSKSQLFQAVTYKRCVSGPVGRRSLCSSRLGRGMRCRCGRRHRRN